MIEAGKTYRIKGESKYFLRKYGTSNPEIVIECALDYHKAFTPATFLYLGRVLAEDLPADGNTYYGHVKEIGEYVYETELEEIG